MKSMLRHICLVALFMLSRAGMMAQQITVDNCSEMSNKWGWPSYYCDCKFNADTFKLPLDRQISDSTWFVAKLSDLSQGLSAYLHSDCDMSFDVYTLCTAETPKYQAVFTSNQTNSVNSQVIKEKLEDMGYGDNVDGTFHICISPILGFGGRLLANTQDKEFHSTCDDPLSIFPGMSLLCTSTEKVYVLNPSDIPYGEDVILQWQGENGAPCQCSITRNECDAEPFVQTTLQTRMDSLILPAELIDQAWEKDEIFYLHLSCAENTRGTIQYLAYHYEEIISDTTLCQGMEFRYDDIRTTKPGVYFYDTLQLSHTRYQLFGYNVKFISPITTNDTIALRYTELPSYSYRGKPIREFGDYTFLFQTPNECDERIRLHVRHNLTTIANVIDTTLCAGSAYKDANDRYYDHEVSLVDSLWQGRDTVLVVYTNVHFSPMDTVHETKKYTAARIKNGVRLYQQIFKDFGDYTINTFDKDGCQMIVYLHIQHSFTTLTKTINELVCVGKVYTHSNGDIYTSSTTIVDSMWTNVDTLTITSTHVTFTSPEAIPDTLALKQAALPYTYRGQETITDFGDYDLTIRTAGECDERYLLHVYHAIDTLYETVSETLCQGKSFTYNGVTYTSSTTFADTLQRDADTYVITSVSVTFTAPEAMPDTLALKQAALPYTYRGQETITDFGDYDLTIRTSGECDERYLLHVYHTIDTLYETVSETLCQGKSFTYNGVTYTSSTTFADTLQRDADTYIITSVSLTFTAPEAIPDTLALKQAALPYTYCGQETITTFGDYDLTIRTSGECDERYLLHLSHDIDTLYTNIDTTLCEGRIFIHNELEYTQPAILLDSNWLNMDTWQITTIDIAFTTPDMEYDTIVVKTEELLAGYYYALADTTLYAAGDYFCEILTYNDCTRYLTLTVNEEVTSAVDNLPHTDQPRLIMRNGLVYILRGKDYYTILGERL